LSVDAAQLELLADFEPTPLTGANAGLVETFQSRESSYAEEVERYLKRQALLESEQGVSKTTLFVSRARGFVGAYATLSATSIPTVGQTSTVLREVLRTEKAFVGAVMIDWVGVSDEVRRTGLRLGERRVLPWLKAEVVAVNRHAAAPLIRLDVSVGNWRAYRTYVIRWNFKALPVMARDGRPRPAPNPDLPAPPPEFDNRTYVKMFLDIYAT